MLNYKEYNNEKKCKNVVSGVIIPTKKLHLIGLFFVAIISFSVFKLPVASLNVFNEVKIITSSWQPDIAGLGKLKFVVNQESTQDVFAEITAMDMPFETTYISQESVDCFVVNGLGGMVVKACLEGRVSKIESGVKKSIYISHGKGLMTVYQDIDTLGVKEGDKVEKNMPIGVSFDSVINFKLLFKNKPISGLVVKDGEMMFL